MSIFFLHAFFPFLVVCLRCDGAPTELLLVLGFAVLFVAAATATAVAASTLELDFADFLAILGRTWDYRGL